MDNPETQTQPADKVLAITNGSVPLDGVKEFELVITDSQFMKMSRHEERRLRGEYYDFKREALGRGWTVNEYFDPRTQETVAKFNPPNVEGSDARNSR